MDSGSHPLFLAAPSLYPLGFVAKHACRVFLPSPPHPFVPFFFSSAHTVVLPAIFEAPRCFSAHHLLVSPLFRPTRVAEAFVRQCASSGMDYPSARPGTTGGPRQASVRFFVVRDFSMLCFGPAIFARVRVRTIARASTHSHPRTSAPARRCCSSPALIYSSFAFFSPLVSLLPSAVACYSTVASISPGL